MQQRLERVWRWELAQDERGVERNTLELAHAGQRQQHVLHREHDVAHGGSPGARPGPSASIAAYARIPRANENLLGVPRLIPGVHARIHQMADGGNFANYFS